MIAYKLFRELKDGSIAPLFINKKQRIAFGEWLDAEEHPTKGYSVRKGWHCTLHPIAPHLSQKNRVWAMVDVEDFINYKRTESQGGTWIVAQKIRVIAKCK